MEKLYSGMFSADPRHILLFIIEHIVVVRSHLLVGGEASWFLQICPGVEIESKSVQKWGLFKCGVCLVVTAYPEGWSLRPSSAFLPSTFHTHSP